MKAQVVFLADAGAGVGWGHVYRLLPVRAALEQDGMHCAFALPASCRETHAADEGMEAFPEGRSGLLAWLDERSPAVIVVDSYRHHQLLGGLGGEMGLPSRIVQFDDHYRPISGCASIVNAAPSASARRYGELGCANASLLLGPQYVALSQDFGRAPGELPPLARKVGRMVVALGGSDTGSRLEELLSSLVAILSPHVEVMVVGDADISVCDARIKAMGWLDQPQLASLMSACDLAVFAGGSMLLQAMSVGLPVLSWPQTEHQRRHAQAWEACGCVALLDDVGSLAAALASLQQIRRRQALRDKGRAMVDGKGAWRIASHVRSLTHREAIC